VPSAAFFDPSPRISFMPLASDTLTALPRKLRRSLKKLCSDASPARVHKFRTRTRRFEVMLAALNLESGKRQQAVLKAIRTLRKKAGVVRDMDVLTEHALRPQPRHEQECSVRLLQQLGSRRERQARKLQKKARKQLSKAGKGLKRCRRLLERQLPPQRNARGDNRRMVAGYPAGLALQLESELRQWPHLTRSNLHEYRKKVKELRYVLQMADNSHGDFVSSLGEVKDAIGEWHDWEELAQIAKDILQHPGCDLLSWIRSTAKQKFQHALDLTNTLRNRYLNRSAHSKHASGTSALATLSSASDLAA
jgi:CHAD domain-containing protein